MEKLETASRKNRRFNVIFAVMNQKRCELCDTEFESIRSIARFCSKKCCDKSAVAKKRAKKQRKEFRACINCNAQFQCDPSSPLLTCSQTCVQAICRKNKQQRPANAI